MRLLGFDEEAKGNGKGNSMARLGESQYFKGHCWGSPNISKDAAGGVSIFQRTLLVTFLRPVPRDSLLEMGKFCWEWGQEEK